MQRHLAADATAQILVFDDATGRVVDVDLRALQQPAAPAADKSRGRGRPKLGVVAREVTLLPRHWEWLNSQSGGASVALRKLVDQARRESAGADRERAARDAGYRFMSVLAGDFPAFEEASCALFAHEPAKFASIVAEWPEDVAEYVTRLAFPA